MKWLRKLWLAALGWYRFRTLPKATLTEVSFWPAMKAGQSFGLGPTVNLYVYRTFPVLEQPIGHKYLARYSHAISAADILQAHGQGRYLLILTEGDPAREVSRAVWDLMECEC